MFVHEFSPDSDPDCQGFVANFPLLQTITKPVPGGSEMGKSMGETKIRGRFYHEDPPITWGNAEYLSKKLAMKHRNPLGISVKKSAGYLSIPRAVFLVMIKCWCLGYVWDIHHGYPRHLVHNFVLILDIFLGILFCLIVSSYLLPSIYIYWLFTLITDWFMI